MTVPHITAVIPAYNAKDTLLRAVSSVLAQTYSDFELIIVDDGSSDTTLELANSVSDQRVRVISQVNLGPGAARNAGLQEAQGRWIAFLDADDSWEPDFFSSALAELRQHPSMLFYFGTTHLATATERCKVSPDTYSTFIFHLNKKATTKRLKRQVDISLCVMLADKDTILSLGGYYGKNKCTYGEDGFLSFLILWNYPIIRSTRIVHVYNMTDAGLSFARHSNVQAKAMVAGTDCLYERLPNGPEKPIRNYIAYLASIDAYRLAKVGKRAEGYQLIRQKEVLKYAYQPTILVSIARFIGYSLVSRFKY